MKDALGCKFQESNSGRVLPNGRQGQPSAPARSTQGVGWGLSHAAAHPPESPIRGPLDAPHSPLRSAGHPCPQRGHWPQCATRRG